MKYYKDIIELRVFGIDDLVRIIGNRKTTESIIREYILKGYIERVRRNLYVALSLENGGPIPERFEIGCAIKKDAVISYHSALEYHGYANQVYHDVYVMTEERFEEFKYDGYIYKRFFKKIPNIDYISYGKAKIATLEQTVIDSIDMISKITGIEELLKSLELMTYLDENKMLDILEKYNSKFLYQKTGAILSMYRE